LQPGAPEWEHSDVDTLEYHETGREKSGEDDLGQAAAAPAESGATESGDGNGGRRRRRRGRRGGQRHRRRREARMARDAGAPGEVNERPRVRAEVHEPRDVEEEHASTDVDVESEGGPARPAARTGRPARSKATA